MDQSFSAASIDKTIQSPRTRAIIRALQRWVPTLLACVLLFLIARRAYTTFDLSWDSVAYQTPFAARSAGIYPESGFQFDPHLEERYRGFPLVGNFLQGMLWRVSGEPNATNLLGFLGLVGLLVYASSRLKLKFWQVALFMLSIPVVVIHSTVSYMDLFPNAMVAIGLVSLLYAIENEKYGIREFAAILLPFVLATNSKFHAIGPVAVWGVIAAVWFGWKRRNDLIVYRRPTRLLGRFVLVGVVLALLGSFTYIENWYTQKNPFYPFDSTYGSVHFKGPESAIDTMMESSLQPALRGKSSPERFLISFLELEIWTTNDGAIWGVSGPRTGAESRSFKTGGFFVANIALWGAVLLVLNLTYRDKKLRIYSVFALIAAVSTSFFPYSHYARYWIYLPLFLAIIVLLLLSHYKSQERQLYRLAIVLQISLLCFVLYQLRAYLRPDPRDWAFDLYGSMIEDQDSELCVYGDLWRFGIVAKIASPETPIQYVIYDASCTFENKLKLGE